MNDMTSKPTRQAGARAQNSTEVRRRILKLMASDAVGPDGRLPTERDLAESCGTTRRTVRRALSALESEGLIWRRQGKGTFAGQALDPTGALAARIARDTTPMEVMEARLCIEPQLAALAATRAEAEDLDRMRRISERALEAKDPDACELWDGALHRLIARSARNGPLLTAFAMLDAIRGTAGWRDRRTECRTVGSVEETLQQHRMIVAAIASGDPDAARDAMRAHLRTRMCALEDAARTGP